MTKPDVTLQPSKGIITQAAAQIYSAYVAAGWVKEDKAAESLMKRAIREAIAIARTVDASVQSDEELPDEGGSLTRESSMEAKPPSSDDAGLPVASLKQLDESSRKPKRPARKARTQNIKSRKATKAKRGSTKDALEDLAEDILMEEDADGAETELALEESGSSNTTETSRQSSAKRSRKPNAKEDAAATAEELLKSTPGDVSDFRVEPNDAL